MEKWKEEKEESDGKGDEEITQRDIRRKEKDLHEKKNKVCKERKLRKREEEKIKVWKGEKGELDGKADEEGAQREIGRKDEPGFRRDERNEGLGEDWRMGCRVGHERQGVRGKDMRENRKDIVNKERGEVR